MMPRLSFESPEAPDPEESWRWLTAVAAFAVALLILGASVCLTALTMMATYDKLDSYRRASVKEICDGSRV